MRKIFFALVSCIALGNAFAQVNINTTWTWTGGDKHIPLKAIPGVKGVSAPDNSPSGRRDAVRWAGADGTVWMFGGYGHGSNVVGALNDLWKYNNATNEWTWISGSISANNFGVYGVQGIAAEENVPGSRHGSSSWVGADGNFYLFGGNGFGSATAGRLNDLWKYDPVVNMWTWVSGPSAVNTTSSYGTEGDTAPGNRPGARNGAIVWQGDDNLIWLFGGDGYAVSSSPGRLSDLWKLDPSTGLWTWMRGANDINAAGGSSVGPSARNTGTTAWKDNAGNLYLFGGAKNGAFTLVNPPCGGGCPGYTLLADFWRYTPSTNTWVQISVTNAPSARYHGLAWTDSSGILWLWGGYGFNSHSAANPGLTVEADLNDLWKFDPSISQWAIVSGDYGEQIPGVYGVMGVTDPNNKKGGRASAVCWINAGKVYSFGGQLLEGAPVSYRNDVWIYDPSNGMHTWLKGDSISSADPVYGQAGVAAPSNKPGERKNSGRWSDNSGNLWLFGGEKPNISDGPPGYYATNDLWKYNVASGQWTWFHGGLFQPGLGIPGRRLKMVTWTDNEGSLWLFGGQGFYASWYDDLWKYIPSSNQWTLMKGSATSYYHATTGHYGMQGVADMFNLPPAKEAAAGWKDNSGNLWMFGGEFDGAQYNDLWKYELSSNMWTWVKGSSSINQWTNSYGAPGVPGVNNNPGARSSAASWTDNAGNFWLFGGGYNGTTQLAGDLWKYVPLTGEWTCYYDAANNPGVYGSRGIAAASNRPGARSRAATWTDATGNLWLMGGFGYDASGNRNHLDDVWMYDVLVNQWTWVKGDNTVNIEGVYGTKGIPHPANKPGSRNGALAWRDAVGDIFLYGGYGFAESGYGPLSDLWKLASPLMSPLPVRFLEFKGHLLNNDAILNWQTENEENASHFIIERSIDRRNYFPVGTKTANNLIGRQQYGLVDPGITSLPTKVVYYRLKQTDYDGKFTYSNIIALTLDRSIMVLLYPNPVSEAVNVTITLDKSETVQARIINMSGAVVKQEQWKLSKGSTSQVIDVSELPGGSYYLDFSGETISKQVKFVKQ